MTKITTNRSITIYGINMDAPYELEDAEQPYASMVIEQFKAGRDITFPSTLEGQEVTIYIPYHSILYIAFSETKTSSTIEDDFCVTDSSDNGGSDEGGSDES